jgi:hypothetical protein
MARYMLFQVNNHAGHRAKPYWRRHRVERRLLHDAACGALALGPAWIEDSPSVQGEVKDCKSCMRLAESWEAR